MMQLPLFGSAGAGDSVNGTPLSARNRGIEFPCWLLLKFQTGLLPLIVV
jgi:hypothetical protein